MTLEHATIYLAIFTAVAAGGTFWLAWESRKSSYRQIGVQTWLELERRFDSVEMKQARRKLAHQLKDYTSAKHSKISETVLNFFESAGIAYKEGLLGEELARSSFSFHACRWWEASRAYILQEQKRHGEDTTLYEDFGDMVLKLRLPGEVIDDDEIRRFLEDEAKLD